MDARNRADGGAPLIRDRHGL